MRDCVYVMFPCTQSQKQRLREAAGETTIHFQDDCTETEQREAFASAAVILGEPKPERLADAPRLRWIQMTWAGADRYTKAAYLPSGLRISCATGVYGGTIAEYIFGTVLSLYRHLPRYTLQQREHIWKPYYPSRGIEGSTVLIVGAGDIGMELAKRLRPFQPATVIGVRRTVRQKPEEFDEMHTMEDLPQLWGRADLVVCSLPNTPLTRGLLNEAALRAMKKDAVLVNVGRGSLVNPDTLCQVLQSGHLAGAVLDVTDPEPLPPDHPLWDLDNVILTPHIAGIGFGNVPETTEKIVDLCCDNLRRYLSGGTPRNLVDFSTGYRSLASAEPDEKL